jgi:hypothetical protein
MMHSAAKLSSHPYGDPSGCHRLGPPWEVGQVHRPVARAAHQARADVHRGVAIMAVKDAAVFVADVGAPSQPPHHRVLGLAHDLVQHLWLVRVGRRVG